VSLSTMSNSSNKSNLSSPPPAPEEAGDPPRRSRKRVLVALALVAALAGAGWWFLLKPAAPAEPKPGEVVRLEPIQVNLAGGHYLKIGIALQLTADAHGADGSKALDATIGLFSGRAMGQLTEPETREKLKHQLLEELDHRYHGEVMDVFFTDFVTQ
jgi:flagellar FliL protein